MIDVLIQFECTSPQTKITHKRGPWATPFEEIPSHHGVLRNSRKGKTKTNCSPKVYPEGGWEPSLQADSVTEGIMEKLMESSEQMSGVGDVENGGGEYRQRRRRSYHRTTMLSSKSAPELSIK